MALPPIVGLEIGTAKVIALVGEMREDGNVMITGMGERPGIGVRKGEIIDLENAVACARAALEDAEESSKVSIRQTLLAVSGGHIQSLINRGAVPVLDEQGEVTQEDIDQVMELARAVNLPPDREIIHTICQYFCIDDQENVVRPEGMEGAKLSLDMLVLHGVRNLLRNAVKVVRSIPMDVQDVAFAGLCSALAVLTPEQKKSGAIVIDLGAGTTDYLVYAGNVVAAAGTIGVGGDHVTNDVAIAFSIPLSQAENLKRDSGNALLKMVDANAHVSLPAEVGFPGRSVRLQSLHTVIHARMEETLDMIRKRLDEQGLLHQVGAGVVICGGGAHLRGIRELVHKVFGLPCTIGRPRHVSGLATATEGPEYAACAGLVLYGFKTAMEERRTSPLTSFVKGLFGR